MSQEKIQISFYAPQQLDLFYVSQLYITCHLKATAMSVPVDSQHKACSFLTDRLVSIEFLQRVAPSLSNRTHFWLQMGGVGWRQQGVHLL